MNGILTQDEVRPQITFVGFDNELGQFTVNKEPVAGVEGKLLGFSKHNLTYKGTEFPKFDIFLANSEGKVIQVQLGMTTWLSMHLMNSLMSLPFDAAGNANGKLRLVAYQKDGSNRIYVTFNGEKLPWKFELAKLKLDDEDKAKREARKNQVCEKFFEALVGNMPYVPAAANGDAVPEDEPVPVAAGDDDLPF